MNLRTLQIADIELPADVERLRDLAYDLWWSWSPAATRLFAWIDPEHWRRYHNPVQLLINVEPAHWMRLLSDPEFRRAFDLVIQDLDAYRSRPRWFEQASQALPGAVAYFSMEFGIHESLGTYSGGLGVLSGDHCKAASDLGVPLVGVGLLYRSGYFRQTVDADGFQQHIYPNYDFARLPILPVQAPNGGVLTVPIDLPGRVVQAAVWKAQVGRVPVLMLDTDIPLNDPADRPITGVLYVRGREMRLCQEIVLGVGGVRALHALGIHPSVWHMNEGHVAFLGLERVRERVRSGDSLDEGLRAVSRNTVFTTHTPVPAGNEAFDKGLVRRYLDFLVREIGCEPDQLLSLGADNGNFNMTVLAIRLSSSTNGVSKLHGAVSSAMWRHLWPGEPAEPVGAVTNGVHTPSWLGPEMRALYVTALGPDWEAHLLDPEPWKRIHEVPDADLWAAHRGQKERLVRFVRERVRQQSARHGFSPDELRQIEGLLDPHALTIGFARRFATYKRAMLILSDMDRLRALLSDPNRPLQFLFAGKAHPADREGQERIRRLVRADPGRVPRQDRLPRGLRHRRWAACSSRAATSGSTPRAAPRGLGHQRHEGRDQRRAQRQHPRRLVGGRLRRRQRLGHRRRRGRPGRDPGAGRQGRRVALSGARDGGGSTLLRSRPERPAPALDRHHEELDRVGGGAVQRPPDGARLRDRELPARGRASRVAVVARRRS